MIAVTRLKGEPLWLNPDLIEHIEEISDTRVTLVDGKVLLLQDSARDVVDAIAAWRASIIAIAAQVSRPAPTRDVEDAPADRPATDIQDVEGGRS